MKDYCTACGFDECKCDTRPTHMMLSREELELLNEFFNRQGYYKEKYKPLATKIHKFLKDTL